MNARTLRTAGTVVLLVLVLGLVLWGQGETGGDRRDTAGTSQTRPADTGLGSIAEADLPPEARRTLALIDAGGPFPYPGKDGDTFRNYEGRLPAQPRGYYAEYTVPTPGEDDRGPRRIVVGKVGDFYWTADHYETFARIVR